MCLGLRSLMVADHLSWATGQNYVAFTSRKLTLDFYVQSGGRSRSRPVRWTTTAIAPTRTGLPGMPSTAPRPAAPASGRFRIPGLAWVHRPFPNRANSVFLGGEIRMLVINDLWLIALAGAFPAYWFSAEYLRHKRRDQYRKDGSCLRCGYDLRNSSGRCPECGKPFMSSAGSRAATQGVPPLPPPGRGLSRLDNLRD
jgi:hypothetical protein